MLAALLNLPNGLPPERDYSQTVPLPELGPAPPRKVAKLSSLMPDATPPESSHKGRAVESGASLASSSGDGRQRNQPVRGGPIVKLEKVESTPLEKEQGDLVGGEEIQVGEGPGAKRRRGSGGLSSEGRLHLCFQLFVVCLNELLLFGLVLLFLRQ